uniref:Uncharacterized protein n=1 Tax=Ditylenchus dipsaci TaxID=166011 RepID=A0A915EGR2_9BILA
MLSLPKTQQILARTGKWFQNPGSEQILATPTRVPLPRSPVTSSLQSGSERSQLQDQEYLDDPSVSACATHQRSISDASAVSSTRRPSEIARKLSVKQRQTTLHRQPSLETDSQQGMNGAAGEFFNGVVNEKDSSTRQQQQSSSVASNHPINNGTPGKGSSKDRWTRSIMSGTMPNIRLYTSKHLQLGEFLKY